MPKQKASEILEKELNSYIAKNELEPSIIETIRSHIQEIDSIKGDKHSHLTIDEKKLLFGLTELPKYISTQNLGIALKILGFPELADYKSLEETKILVYENGHIERKKISDIIHAF